MLLTTFWFQGPLFGENTVQVAAFKDLLEKGDQIANCANCDFRGTQELAGVDAHGAHLPGVTLQPCVPSDVNEKTLTVCVPGQVANLTKINLANANMFSSCLDEAILDNADLTNVDLSNSSVRFASLKDAKVTGIITENSTFCNTIMPDGTRCIETWTGQGVTIACNCSDQDKALAMQDAVKADVTKTTSTTQATTEKP